MQHEEKINLINRISTGLIVLEINNQLYELRQPSRQDRAVSQFLYNKIINDTKYENLITREYAKEYLNRAGIWTMEDDRNYEKLKDYLESLKIDLYRALYNKNKQKSIRRRIKNIKTGLQKSLMKKYSLDYMTLENHAESISSNFLTAVCIYDMRGNQVYTYENFMSHDNYILQRFLNYLNHNIITQEQYREIARTEPFRTMWAIGKENVFGCNVIDMSEDQRSMIIYSKMYDSVYEHTERPTDEVINDDDMLDGWFAQERRSTEKERKQKEIDRLLDRKGVNRDGAGEMFVVVESPEEAEKIREINDFTARHKMKQRIEVVQNQGRIEEQKLPDVQIELRNQAMKEFANKRG